MCRLAIGKRFALISFDGISICAVGIAEINKITLQCLLSFEFLGLVANVQTYKIIDLEFEVKHMSSSNDVKMTDPLLRDKIFAALCKF